MNKDVVFTGSKKADAWLIFTYLSEIVADAEFKNFFSYNRDLSRKLAVYYSKANVDKIIARAYTLVDECGNSLLSLAYEHNNADMVGAISSFILAHGYENESLYLPLVSPKFLMLSRKMGYVGCFSDNLISIFKQMINSGNTKWAKELASCYSFVSITEEDFSEDSSNQNRRSKNISVKNSKMPILSAVVVKFLKIRRNPDSFLAQAVNKVFSGV